MKKINLIKRLVVAILLFCMTFSFFGCGKTKSDAVLLKPGMQYVVSEKGEPVDYVTKSFDIIGGDSVMPIGMYASFPVSGGSDNGNVRDNFITEKYFELIKECGVNLSVYTTQFYEHDPISYRKLLDLGDQYNIGFFVPSAYLSSKVGQRTQGEYIESVNKNKIYDKIMEVSENLSHRSFVGLWMYDEPFPNWQLKNVKLLTEAVRELNLPGVMPYCNVNGYWEGENNFWGYANNTLYEDYAEEFMECDFPVISGTQYPYIKHWPALEEKNQDSALRGNLFKELSVYRALSVKYNKPAWRMLQAGGDWGVDKAPDVDYYPDEGEMLYDINTSLAFGMKGIQYYTGFGHHGDCVNSDGTIDAERSGLIGYYGNINRWYYFAQKANRQIKAVDHVLMHSSNQGVLLSGEKTKNLVGDPLKDTVYSEYDPIIKENSYRQLKSVEGEAIIGCMDYMGGTALYIVNGSRNDKNEITLSFDNKYCYDVIQRTVSTAIVGKTFTLTLEAGEGALVVIR